MSKRLPITERAENPPPMRLTERDKDIVVAVYTHRMLTREQIKRLLFEREGAKPSAVDFISKKRLKLLYHHGFLDRKPLPVVEGKGPGQPPLVYFLDKLGVNLVAEALQIDREEINWKKKDNEVKILFLEHTLKLNDVRIAIELAAPACGFELLRWVDERALKSLNEKVADPANPSRTLPLNPDAFLALDLGGRKAMFFLELDQATMTRARFGTKVRAYQSYRLSGKSYQRFKTRKFRMLTVTTGEKRLANLVETTQKAGGDDHFWFTLYEQVSEDSVLGKPIWRVVGGKGRRTLIE